MASTRIPAGSGLVTVSAIAMNKSNKSNLTPILKVRWYLAVTLFAAMLAGCGGPAREPLRIAANPWPGYACLFLAQDCGYYERENVGVELVELDSLNDVSMAYEMRQVDVMACSTIEFLNVVANAGRPTRVFMVVDYSNGADMLLARPGINSLAELRGKRIAYEPFTLDVVMLHHALRRGGLSLADVRARPMDQRQMLARYISGDVDAVQIYPPRSEEFMAAGGRRLFDSSQVPYAAVDILVADAALFAEREEELAGIVRAFFAARRFAAEQPDAAEPLMATRLKTNRPALRQALAGMRLCALEEQAELLRPEGRLAANLVETEAIMRANGMLDGAVRHDGLTATGPSVRAVAP